MARSYVSSNDYFLDFSFWFGLGQSSLAGRFLKALMAIDKGHHSSSWSKPQHSPKEALS